MVVKGRDGRTVLLQRCDCCSPCCHTCSRAFLNLIPFPGVAVGDWTSSRRTWLPRRGWPRSKQLPPTRMRGTSCEPGTGSGLGMQQLAQAAETVHGRVEGGHPEWKGGSNAGVVVGLATCVYRTNAHPRAAEPFMRRTPRACRDGARCPHQTRTHAANPHDLTIWLTNAPCCLHLTCSSNSQGAPLLCGRVEVMHSQ